MQRYKMKVLGFMPNKQCFGLIDEVKFYHEKLPGEKAVQEWFAELCSDNYEMDAFVPCILDSYEIVEAA